MTPPFAHPCDPISGRYLCAPAHPMPADAPPDSRWVHTGAHELPDSQRDGWPSGDTVEKACRDCGVTWTEELPQ